MFRFFWNSSAKLAKSENNTSTPTSKNDTGLVTLPGLSYIPDKIEVSENVDLLVKVETEFLDFLTCVTDILRLLHMIKSKHLRSMTPIPYTILREMKSLNGKGPLFKKYDRSMSGAISGISASADNLFKRGMSVASGPFSRSNRPLLVKRDAPKKRPIELDLVEITGKKTKPIWHVVALEPPPDPLLELKSAVHETKNCTHLEVSTKGKNHQLSRTLSETIIANIKYLRCLNLKVKPSKEVYQQQMDMLSASDAGFDSVEAYMNYLETLKPHWYKDLLRDAVKVGIVESQEIVEAFVTLGQYMNLDETNLILPKSKLCFMVMSMPIWDIGRVTVQRAVDFVLYNILKVPKTTNVLEEWLSVRKLPYVVLPQVHADSLMSDSTTQNRMPPSAPAADPSNDPNVKQS